MIKIKGIKKCDGRKIYMRKLKTKSNMPNLLDILIEQSSDDWEKLCTTCSTLVKEAKMSNEDIDNIVERVKKENG